MRLPKVPPKIAFITEIASRSGVENATPGCARSTWLCVAPGKSTRTSRAAFSFSFRLPAAERLLELGLEVGLGNVAGDDDGRVLGREDLLVGLHERVALDGLHVLLASGRRVPVRVLPPEHRRRDRVGGHGAGALLVRHERAEAALAKTRDLFFGERGGLHDLAEDRERGVEVLREHLEGDVTGVDVDARAVLRAERLVVVGELERAALARALLEHRAHERRDARLEIGVVARAALDGDAHADDRELAAFHEEHAKPVLELERLDLGRHEGHGAFRRRRLVAERSVGRDAHGRRRFGGARRRGDGGRRRDDGRLRATLGAAAREDESDGQR